MRGPRATLGALLLAATAACGDDPPAPPARATPPAPTRPRSRDEVATFLQIMVGYRSERFPDTFRRSASEARARADDLLEQLRAGTPMERLIAEHTDDRDDAGKPFNGGSYTIARGVTPVMPVVEKVVFSLAKGELARAPVDTGVAFLLIRRED